MAMIDYILSGGPADGEKGVTMSPSSSLDVYDGTGYAHRYIRAGRLDSAGREIYRYSESIKI
jgi:hypothetical protein